VDWNDAKRIPAVRSESRFSRTTCRLLGAAKCTTATMARQRDFSAKTPNFLARDRKICISALRYTRAAPKLAFAGACMSRDDLLFWCSLVWFFVLTGAAIWALLWL